MQTLTVRNEVSLYTLFRGNLDSQGLSMAHARLELRVRSLAGSYGICGGQSDTETVFPSAPYSSLSSAKLLSIKGQRAEHGNVATNRKISGKEVQYFVASGHRRCFAFILESSFISRSCQEECIS